MAETTMKLTAQQHLQCGKALFNFTWTLLEKADRTEDESELMVKAAHASALHWLQVGKPVNFARSEWQISRVYAVLNRPEPALHHARRCRQICEDHEIGDFDLAFAYEALARAYAAAGGHDHAKGFLEMAREAGKRIADAHEREHFFDDLRTVPGYEGK